MDTNSTIHGLISAFLAAERTYLASVRTALALLGFGMVLAKVFIENKYGYRTSAYVTGSSVLAAIIYLGFSSYRYFHVVNMLQRNTFEVDIIGPAFMMVFCFFLFFCAALVAKRVAGRKKEENNNKGTPLLNTQKGELSDELIENMNKVMEQQAELLRKLNNNNNNNSNNNNNIYESIINISSD
eukprot:m.304898 g.304898  ORF g.304898 m.304898 type:complete len:184 (+) comp16443_c0_seq1:100-651(+)